MNHKDPYCSVQCGVVIQPNRGDQIFIQEGWTALLCAVRLGFADTARVLLENGTTMDFEDTVRRSDMIMFLMIILSCSVGKNHFDMQLNKALMEL